MFLSFSSLLKDVGVRGLILIFFVIIIVPQKEGGQREYFYNMVL